jgi:uncharacterized membrane protein YdjX (TVP38/TMEM64 family)
MKNFLCTAAFSTWKLKMAIFVVLLIFLCALSAAWQWTPLKYWSEPERLLGLLKAFSTTATAPLIAIAAYVIGGLVMFPIVVLIPVTALMFGPVLGPAYALAGCLSSAVICYVLGLQIGSEAVTRLAGRRSEYISRQLASKGFLTIATFRLLPVAPYTIVNLIAGAFGMRFRDYTLGTAAGLLPGIVIMTVVAGTAEKALINPDMKNIGLLAVISLLVFIAFAWIKRRVAAPDAAE